MCAKLLDATTIWCVTARVATRFPRTRRQVLPTALFALLLAPLWGGPTAAQQATATSFGGKHPCGHGNQPPCPPPPPPPPPPTAPTLTLTVNPQMSSIPSSTPLGTVVATATAAWSDGSAFTGTIMFGSPYGDDGGTFALSCTQCATANIVISPLGPGIMADGGMVQKVTIVATQ